MTEQSSPHSADREPPNGVDTTVPHSARIWNYWLGGKDNFAVDRQVGDQVYETFAGIVDIARTGRGFLTRAVRYLAGAAGIRQFLDIGTGLPTADNTHDVAQRVARQSRIVYVDNDPLVLAYARALLTSTPEGKTAYVDADLHDPDTILDAAAETLDFTRPIALMLMGILGHIDGYDAARSIVNRLVDALPSGSHLALYDSTNTDKGVVEAQQRYNESGTLPYYVRSPDEIAGFFEGLQLVEPGLVSCPRWRPEVTAFGSPADVVTLAAVGRKT